MAELTMAMIAVIVTAAAKSMANTYMDMGFVPPT
jgi:hypothetical protein